MREKLVDAINSAISKKWEIKNKFIKRLLHIKC